jgi:glycine oxidase
VGTLLLERDEIASGASGGAAGIATPGVEGSRGGPFLDLARAGLAALREEVPRLAAETGVDVGYRADGVLEVAEDDAEAASLRASARRSLDGARFLGARELRELEPALAARLCGAALLPRDVHVVSPWLVHALATRALRRGATIREHTRVRALLRAQGRVIGARTDEGELRARAVVLAAGPWSSELSPAPLPVRPVKGQLAYLRPARALLHRPVFGRGVYLAPKADGRLVVGATEEDAGFDATPRDDTSRDLVARAARLVPELESEPVAGAWAGLRPATPDRLPVIGTRGDLPGVIFATGHFRNGVLLSLVTARVVASLVAGVRPPVDIAAFSPERFG